MKQFLTLSSLFVVLVLAVGCDDGPAVAPVTGTVTQDGEPLYGAMVEFQPDAGAPSYGYTYENGVYEIQYQVDKMGALIGHHYVSVTTAGEKTDPKTDTTINVPETVPRIYNDPTELEYVVKSGKNVFDIPIEGKRKGGRRRN